MLALAAWANARAVPDRKSLAAAASGADRVVVVAGLFEPREEDWGKPLFEVRGEAEAASLLSAIDIEVPPHGLLWSESRRCGCDGRYHFEFYRGDRLLVSVGWHGEHVRWRGGPWGTDVRLTPASQEAVPRWFEERGFARIAERWRLEARR